MDRDVNAKSLTISFLDDFKRKYPRKVSFANTNTLPLKSRDFQGHTRMNVSLKSETTNDIRIQKGGKLREV